MAMQFDQNSAVFELELETSKFERNAKRAERSFSVFADRTTDRIVTVAQDFKNYLVNDLALNAIKGAFEKTFEYLADYASKSKELVKIADSTTISVEALSKLQAVAKGAEIDLTELANVANALSFEALSDSATALGLSLDELEGQDQADRFSAVVDALANVPKEADRARIALELFGDSAENLTPILNGASGSTRAMIDAAKDAGLIATEENARNAAKFADSLEKLKAAASGVGAVLASAVLPAFQEAADMITEVARAINKLNGGASDASLEIDRVAKETRKAREEGEKLRELDAGKFSFVADLAGQGTLTAEVFEKAASTVEELQNRYGDLGFSVDKAARSIEAATDAQDRFNEAAKAQKRAEIEKEIAAAEANERDLGKQAEEKLKSYDSFGKQLANMPRAALSYATGGAVQSVSQKWETEIDSIRSKQTEERKRLIELRKELTQFDDAQASARLQPQAARMAGGWQNRSEQTKQPDNLTPVEVPKPTPAEEPTKAEVPKPSPVEEPTKAEVPKPSPVEEPTKSEVPKPTPAKEPTKAEVPKPSPVEEPTKAEVPKPSPVEEPTKSEVPKPTPAKEPTPQNPTTAEVPTPPQPAKSEPTPKQARLDEEIARFEERKRRETQSNEQNAVDETIKEESAYREKLQERVIEERSKGKSGQDSALIDRLTALIEESTKREEAKIAALKEEESKRLAEESKGENVLVEIAPEELQTQDKGDGEIDWNPDALEKYFEDAYKATEKTVQASTATFNAFDAKQIAQASADERALKESERQTRLLEELRNYAREGTAVFA